MHSHRLGLRRRHIEKLALDGLRVALALFFGVLGYEFLFVPGVAEDLDRIGCGVVFRVILGISHLAGGMALLVPRLARETTMVLGLIVAGIAVDLYSQGESLRAAGPAMMAMVLFLFSVWLRLRDHIDTQLWIEVLGRYADQQDSGRSESA